MSLVSALARRVPSWVRTRGENYFFGGRVHLLVDQADRLESTVQGSQSYDVVIVRTHSAVRVRCTCPLYLRERGVCKHIWATLVAADRSGPWSVASAPAQRARAGNVAVLSADATTGNEATDSLARRDAGGARKAGAAAGVSMWRRHVARLRSPEAAFPQKEIDEVLYRIDVKASRSRERLIVQLQERSRKANGDWGKPHDLRVRPDDVTTRVVQPSDRQILSLLSGGRTFYEWSSYQPNEALPARIAVSGELTTMLLPLLCATGRAFLTLDPAPTEGEALVWDDGPAWELWIEVRGTAKAGYRVTASLRRGDQRKGLEDFALLLSSGFAIDGRVARLEHRGSFSWISVLRDVGELVVPPGEVEDLLAEIVSFPSSPFLDLPAELRLVQVTEVPSRRLVLRAPERESPTWHTAELWFRYSPGEISAMAPERRLFDRTTRRLVQRDEEFEAQSVERMAEVGFKRAPGAADLRESRLRDRDFGRAVRALLAENWKIEAEGIRLRSVSDFRLAVSSQIDWFELEGGVDFEGQHVPFPALLAALRRGEATILLGDGSSGMLPEEWLRRLAPLAALGTTEGDAMRFGKAQVGLLDALLTAEPTATFDPGFVQARRQLEKFSGLQAAEPSRRFVGALRPYQKFGLGWFAFLREFGFGGCLADDMGLGKTVQVLALLAGRKGAVRGRRAAPSLVVAPRSVLFNWFAEAQRFVPDLRVRNHSGIARATEASGLGRTDLVLTTYGTLRRDIRWLREVEFDYAILDEAQAIKNPASESAKAARLLSARHRLALTGTPVENHLGDLWSLLEFLNPGIGGTSTALRSASGILRDPEPSVRADLARAVRPFILRRTKSQVAPELPRRNEQTIYCELRAGQRRLYNELRDHYRAALGAKVQQQGLGRVKILVLEALLRLRQAACHPGLLDPTQADEPSAKLEFLLPQLQEVLAEGHKALVFSQFTTFLGLVRREVERLHIDHEYLDGRTRDREERVTRFQNDPGCRLFLISLRAGGLGLNLTAAEYVYLLDPWWNPAVEAQAIDRAHRIGQERHVFAYRIVAKDTVEEKILALQETKRELADAIIGRDDSLLRRMTREDLDLLLS